MRRDTQRGTDRGTGSGDRTPARIQNLSAAAQERFDEQVCPTCGQPLQQGQQGHLDRGGFIEETEAVQAGGRVGRAKWSTVALLSIFAAALFIGWRSERSEPAGEPDALVPLAENTDDDATADTNDGSGSAEPDGDLPAGDLPDGVASSGAAVSAQRTLASLLGRHRLAYAAADGVVVVDPESTDPVRILIPEQVTMEDLLVGFDSFSMFEEQGHTYGFKRGAGSVAERVYVLFTQGEVVAGERGGFALVVGGAEAADHLYIGNSAGLFMSRIDVPVGAELLAVPSVGVLVVSSTGETFVTTQSGFTHYSDWPVTAANATHHVEIRCAVPLVCTPVLVDHSSGEPVELNWPKQSQTAATRRVNYSSSGVTDLPLEFAGSSANITISPNGGSLLLTNHDTSLSGPDHLYDVAAAELTALSGKVGNPVAWAPDSTVAAWLDPATTDPRLWVLDVSTAELRSVDLTSLGAPTPAGNALLLLP